MKRLLIIVLVSTLFAGCFSTGRITRKIVNFNDHNEYAVATATRTLYPCITTDSSVHHDTTYVDNPILDSLKHALDSIQGTKPSDTIIYRPDSSCVIEANKLRRYSHSLENSVDGLRVELAKKPKEVIITTTVTKTVEDSAHVKLAYIERDKAIKDKDAYVHNYEVNKWWKKFFMIAFFISLGLNVVQFKFKLF